MRSEDSRHSGDIEPREPLGLCTLYKKRPHTV